MEATTATVQVEIVAWITRFVGGDGTGRRIVEEPLAPRATVRSVLGGLTAKFPELGAALWLGSELGEHIEVLVNDAVLGLAHTLDSPVKPGDRLTLLAQFMGGSHGHLSRAISPLASPVGRSQLARRATHVGCGLTLR
jgi:molybdopterin converting factor small subunit